MFRKQLINSTFIGAVLLMFTSLALAQNAPVSGKVELEKADGSKVPVAGALVEVFRVDIKASFPSDKTDKKGNFSFAGLPLGATFVLSVSAPGANPTYLPGVKPGMAGTDKITITLKEGDGRRLTEDEVRGALSNAPATNSSKPAELTAEQKKQKEEYDKAVAKNKEIENKNSVIQKAFEDGNNAIKAKDYSAAIARYTAGIDADPDFAGSAPVLLNNRAVAYRLRAIDEYNAAVKAADAEKTAGMEKAKEDLLASLDSYNRSLAVLKGAPPADITPATAEKAKYDALSGLVETHRLLVTTKSDLTKADEAQQAFDAYFAVETDAVKKAKAQLNYADMMREIGDSEKAIAGYRVVLQNSPDNVDAMAGLGLSLFNQGVIANDKALLQEGLNFMQKFVETAPDTHPLKASVKDAVDYLRSQEKLTPQKVTPAPKKKP
jgi:tetratricopeptide (TPR) repeat protein